jgi:solute carrier family 35 protein F5
VLVSVSDSTTSSPTALATHSPTAHARTTGSGAALGDFLALASALCYALYVILLKVRIKSESRVDMQLFFGFVGLVNVVTCWPIGLLLHITGLEVFELPPSRKAWEAILVNVRFAFFCSL